MFYCQGNIPGWRHRSQPDFNKNDFSVIMEPTVSDISEEPPQVGETPANKRGNTELEDDESSSVETLREVS